MRRIALLCAVMCLCTTAAVAWGRSTAGHTVASHSSRATHVKSHQRTRGSHHKAKRPSSKKSSTSKTTSKKNKTATAGNVSSAATSEALLFGDQTVETTADNNPAGLAEAFPFTGHAAGTARTIEVYIDSHSTAKSVLGAIYADTNGHPGALVSSGTLSSPKAGAWNAIPISAATVSASKSYWLAVMGKSGTMYFRDRASGPCESVNSHQTGMSALPSSWTNGSSWSTCPISAYASSTATAVTSSNPPKTTSGAPVTTTTTTSTTTTSAPITLPTLPVPPLPLQAPQISGTAMQGQTLTTDNGSWLDGPTSYSYQWQDCGTNGANCASIAGATNSSYTLVRSDVGDTIRVVVTASNSGGSTPASSAQTGVVAPLPAPTNTAAPAISGTATQGQTLTTSKGTWTGSPTSYAYQWRDCNTSGASCANISGATSSSYTLTSNEVGDTVRVVVTATNGGGSTAATSSQTGVVASSAPSAPTNTTAPAISGTATQGQSLSASQGTWTGSPTSYAYQWEDCNTSGSGCANISGATSSSYTLTSNEVGDTLRVAVTATNGGGSASATSAASAVVAAASGGSSSAPSNTVAPYFTASTGDAVVGQTLSVTPGTWSNNPASYTYQWKDCTTTSHQPPTTGSCSNVSSGGTSSNYTVASGDVGHSLEVTVTASNSAGAGSPVTSAPSAVAATSQTGESFCSNAPVTCGYPDYLSGNVGVPAQTNLVPLAQAQLPSGASQSGGNLTISGNNVTVSGVLINGMVTMTGKNDTLQNSQVICGGCSTAVTEGNNTTATSNNWVKYTTISGSGTGCGKEITNAAIGYNYMNAVGVYVYWAAEGINGSDENLQDSYIQSNTFCSNPLDHTEPVNAGDGNGSDAQELVQHNTLDNPESQTAAFITGGDWGQLVNTHVTNNLLMGGGYTIYCCETSAWGVNQAPQNTSVTNNRFSRKYYPNGGGYGPVAEMNTSDTTYTGNIWDDTRSAVAAG